MGQPPSCRIAASCALPAMTRSAIRGHRDIRVHLRPFAFFALSLSCFAAGKAPRQEKGPGLPCQLRPLQDARVEHDHSNVVGFAGELSRIWSMAAMSSSVSPSLQPKAASASPRRTRFAGFTAAIPIMRPADTARSEPGQHQSPVAAAGGDRGRPGGQSQKPSEIPKYRASRKSVSAVIDRLPSTISLIRRGGTPIARARPFCVRPIGSMNSSGRTSPGVGWLGICLVVVDDFDTVGTSCRPDEADAPLPIDADAVLPCAVAFQGLQLVIRRHGEILRRLGVVQHPQLPESGGLDVVRQGAAERSAPDALGFPVAKSDDHAEA